MIKTTKAQRKAVYNKYLVSRQHSTEVRNGFQCTNYYRSYRHMLRQCKETIGCDGAITVYWCNMWLCIETDGYVHT